MAREHRHSAEVRVDTLYHLDRQHIAHIGYEIWNFGWLPPEPRSVFKSSLLEKSRTFEELGTESPRISDLPASKDIWEWQFPIIFSMKSDKYEIYTNDKLKPSSEKWLVSKPKSSLLLQM